MQQKRYFTFYGHILPHNPHLHYNRGQVMIKVMIKIKKLMIKREKPVMTDKYTH